MYKNTWFLNEEVIAVPALNWKVFVRICEKNILILPNIDFCRIR